MRYFRFGAFIMALPLDVYGGLSVWEHHPDGGIEREHLEQVAALARAGGEGE